MRTAIQAGSLLAFVGLFALANVRLPEWLPVDLYLRLDPLLLLGAVVAERAWIARALWALPLLVATLLFGRFFCGYLCPLGAILDFFDPLFHGGRRRRPPAPEAAWRQVRFALLAVIGAAALGGLSLAYLLDPIALLTRTFTYVFAPAAAVIANLGLDLVRPAAVRLGWIDLAYLSLPQPAYFTALATAVLFAGIVALGRVAPRFWCRYLCPLGALLSLTAPLSLFRRRATAECTACNRCRSACPVGAIVEGADPVSPRDCLLCRRCAEACPHKAVRFPALPAAGERFSRAGEHGPVALSRRTFLAATGGGLSLATLTEQTPFSRLHGKRQLVRPPGALPEPAFLRLCLRCGLCMQSCPTNTLQPCLWESGLAGMWTPRLALRYAPCDQHCAVCGQVCPSQAIRGLPLAEKTHARIGTAVLKKELCLVWAQDKPCLICDEICPYNAIVFRTVEGHRRPVVIAARCNGCGFCEERCPVKGEAAIVVVPDGEIRLEEGSYRAEAERLQYQFVPHPGDDRFFFSGPDPKPDGPPAPSPPAPGKPRGFL
ncbi:MAG: 4Fe-4S binding protein [Candidatus Methylomirabilota bacterium]